jgi:hypothetical protein
VATMARPTSSSVADSTLNCLRGNHQIRTRKNLPPFPYRKVTGVEAGAHGRPCGADTVRATVYVQRDDLLETRSTTATAEGARPPSPRYRARLSFVSARVRCIPPRQHRPFERSSPVPLCRGSRR